MHKTGIFCRTESVAMTLKIMCTYAQYVTLGSRCKMASNHTVGPLFISSLLFHLSRALLGAWRFSFSFCLLQLSQQAGPFIGCFILFSLFVSSYVKMKKFCSSYFNRLPISWPPSVRVWGWASYQFLPFTVFSLGLPFCFSSYIVHL